MASSSTKEDITFLQLLQDKYLECSLCIGDYRQPKSLACLHTFCLSCLQDFVKHNPGDIVCPTCRDITPIPKDGVQGLKSNFLIKALTDEAVLFKNQSVKCNNCEDGGNIASMVCVECAQYLCSTCYKSHQALKVIRDSHNTFEVKQLADIVNLREFQKNRFSTCQIHKDPMKLYCKKDSIQLCHTCAFASSHRGHIVCPLQEQLDDLSAEIEKSLGKCAVDENQVKTENMKLKELVDLAKQTEKKSLDDIDNEEKQLIKIVKEKYIKLREEIRTSSEETITSCQHKIEKNNALMKSYESKIIAKDGLQMIPIFLCIEAAEGVLTGVKEMMKVSVLKKEGSDEQKLRRFESKGNVDVDIIVGSMQCEFPSSSADAQSRGVSYPQRVCPRRIEDCRDVPRNPTDETLPHYRNGRNVKVGDIVQRGPDWDYGDQDGGLGKGGVVTKLGNTGTHRTIVNWDNGKRMHPCDYRMGENNEYDLQLLE